MVYATESAGHDVKPCWDGGERTRERVVKDARLACENIKPGRYRASGTIAGEIVPTKGIGHEEDDIHRGLLVTRVLFTGCGSTYYLALAAAALFQELTGLPARALPAGELVMYPEVAYTKAGHTLLVAVSRSGETTETLLAVEAFQRRRAGKAIALTNYGASPLASLSPFCLVVSAGQEVSVAQTRSFSSLYVACIAITCLLAGRQDFIERLASLPAVGSRLIARYEELARSLGGRTDLDRFYFLGSGPRYGLACESSLKIKEMTLTHSEPFHFLEFRHGPKAMVGQDTLVVGLLSTAARGYEEAVLREMQELGAEVLSLGEGEAMINFESGLPESVRNVLYLPILQLFACYRAAGKATSTRGRGAPQIDLCLTSTWS